jgi:hypothetical protein
VDEDLVSNNATILTTVDNNDDARERAREKLFRMANEIGARIKEVENKEARRATTEECIAAFNHVLFTAENFKFPGTSTMLRFEFQNKRISFSSAINQKNGVCADVTGIYLSLVDILARQGLRFEVAAKQAPGHVFACWKDGDRETNVELTADGKVITDEEYRKSFHIDAGSSKAMSLDTCGLASLLHNSAIALVDGSPELALLYSKIRLELDKTVGAYQLRGAILISTLGSNPEKRSSIFEEISMCAERSLEIDPESPTPQLLALRMRADREPDKGKRLALINEALNYVRELKEKGLTNRPSTLLGITIEHSWEPDLAELYLAKYEITEDQKDLDAAEVATLRAEAAALLETGAIRTRAPLAFASARAHKSAAELNGFLERVNSEIEKCVRDSLAPEAKNGSSLTSAAEARLANSLLKLDSSQHSLRRAIAVDMAFSSPRNALEVRALIYLQMAEIAMTNGEGEAARGYYKLAGEDFKMVLAPSAYEESYPRLEIDMDGKKIEVKPRAKRDITKSARSEENVQALVGLAVCQHNLGETVPLSDTIVKLKTLLEIGNETFADYVRRRERDFRDYRDVSWKADRASLERLIANPELAKRMDNTIRD